VTPTKVIYLINNSVVAEITTNIPTVALALNISAAIPTGAVARTADTTRVDIASVRAWYDDPPAGSELAEAAEESGAIAVATSTEATPTQESLAQEELSVFESATNYVQHLTQVVMDGIYDSVAMVVDRFTAITGIFQNLFAKNTTVLPDGSITVPAGDNQMAGSASILQGENTLFVQNTKVQEGAKIFLTPTSETEYPLFLSGITPGEGFTVKMTSSQSHDVSFDWMMLLTYFTGSQTNTSISSPTSTTTPSTIEEPEDSGTEPVVIEGTEGTPATEHETQPTSPEQAPSEPEVTPEPTAETPAPTETPADTSTEESSASAPAESTSSETSSESI
jgi:hypothetical protein